MANEDDATVVEKTDENPEEGSQQGGKKKLIMLGGIGVGAILLAVVLALFVIKPMMAGDETAAEGEPVAEESHDSHAGGSDSHAKKDDGHGKKDDGHGGGHGGGGSDLVYTIGDIVVNPAGTGGSRFLSASFAFELEDAELQKRMANREAMVRDALITILSSKTVPQLTDPKQREITRYQIKKRVEALLATEEVANVYFTDFVLQ